MYLFPVLFNFSNKERKVFEGGDYIIPGSPTDLLCHLALNFLGIEFLSLGWQIPWPWETLVLNNDSPPHRT